MYYWDAIQRNTNSSVRAVSVVVRRMYYWDPNAILVRLMDKSFSSC